jgi:hypothetical protein
VQELEAEQQREERACAGAPRARGGAERRRRSSHTVSCSLLSRLGSGVALCLELLQAAIASGEASGAVVAKPLRALLKKEEEHDGVGSSQAEQCSAMDTGCGCRRRCRCRLQREGGGQGS